MKRTEKKPVIKQKRRRRSSQMVKLMALSPEDWAAMTDNGKNPILYEIKRIEEMEKEAWHMYHAHGGTVEEITETVETNEAGNVVSKSTKRRIRNDPRVAMNWFDRIIKLQEKRLAMLDFDAKRASRAMNAVTKGDYDGFNPQAAWPVPNKEIVDAR
ncbi:MAG: hypothetical protein DRI46_07795 [Chloroflexi bacterium]|nr:MAG: hypothetical protein DRI46_07795 [Chloroflexota bacterium]